MRKFLATAAIAASFAAAPVANALSIDDFQTAAVVNAVGAGASDTTNTAPGSFIGTNRELSGTVGAGGGTIDAAINGAGFPGVLDMQNNVLSAGTVFVEWSGIGGADFTDGGTSSGIFVGLPAPINNALSITFLVNGTSSLTRNFLSGASGNDFFFSFAAFSPSDPFTAVNTLRMTMTGPAGWDAAVDLVETRTDPTGSAPTPGTTLLIGLGLIGLSRQMKKRA